MLCHIEVRKIAREMAGTVYEELAKGDLFYKQNPDIDAFVNVYWKIFIAEARGALAGMLGQNYPENIKEQIFKIILQDKELQQMVPKGTKVMGTA